MEFVFAFILAHIWPAILAFTIQFWGWIVAAGVAVLGFLFSPTLRKYTIAALALLAILGGTYLYAYNQGYQSPHPVTPPACSEFAKHLKGGPATDAALKIFKKNKLCV